MTIKTNDLILAAIIGHGREGYALARRYLADLEAPFPEPQHAKIWAALGRVGEREGPVNLAALMVDNSAQSSEEQTNHEQLRALVADVGEFGLERLESKLASLRRGIRHAQNAAAIDRYAANYRSGTSDLGGLELLSERLDDGGIAGPATSARSLVAYLRPLFNPETEVPPVIPTGFASLDAQLGGGFAPGELIVLGGRPGCAKSLLALATARNGTWAHAPMELTGKAAATRITVPNPEPVHTLIVSLEMSRWEHAARLSADLCDFDGRLLRSDRVGTLQERGPAINAMLDVWEQTDALSIVDLDTPELGGGDIHAITSTISGWARDKRKEHGESVGLLVFVDYIGHCRLSESMAHAPLQTNERFGVFSRRLKRTAQREGIPIVALAQLNRDSSKRDTGSKGKKRYPRLEDLKASGDLEQDADTVLFVDHDHANRPGEEPPESTELAVVIAKGRNVGHGAIVKLAWTRSRTRLTDPRAAARYRAANTPPSKPAKGA